MTNTRFLTKAIRSAMALDDIATFDENTIALGINAQNTSLHAPLFTRKNDDNITFFDLHIIPRIKELLEQER